MEAKRITLTTSRLVLRPIALEDVEAAHDALQHLHVSRWLLSVPHPYSPQDAQAFFTRMLEHERTTGEPPPWAITLVGESNRMMGCIGLHLTMRHRRGEMGYWLHPSLWGRGLMLEALQGVLHAGFEGFDLLRISAGHFPGNYASARVMQKAGMTREGCLKQYLIKDGQSLDEVIYAITAEEWRVLQSNYARTPRAGLRGIEPPLPWKSPAIG